MFQAILDFLFPKKCLFCQKITEDTDRLICDQCTLKLPLIQNPFCQRCGQPLPQSIFHKKIDNPKSCPACQNKKFPFKQSRSVMLYDEDTSRLVLQLKYGDQTQFGQIFADLSFLNHGDIFEDVDMIIPIPIANKRLIRRQYNQSALIGQGLSKRTGLPLRTDILFRTHFKGSQGGLSFQKRHENVKNAFKVKKPLDLKGKSILLVDDVMASGATILSASRTLKKEGAKMIKVITIARTV